MKIGFLYYTFYPVTGGASVHGYYLARELSKAGHTLYKLNGEQDPYTTKLTPSWLGAIRILWLSDLIYARADFFLYPRNFITALALLMGKKVILELNSPSDELKLHGKSDAYIRRVDKIAAWFFKKACGVITVSEPIRRYCEQELGLSQVYVVENGGEPFLSSEEKASKQVKERTREICNKFPVRVVWSGSVNKMQNISLLKKVADADPKRIALLILANVEGDAAEFSPVFQNDNVFTFKNLPREDVEHLVSVGTAGLAFYQDYSWCRWGFYNSSLKIFEYLNNGLITLTNTPGTPVQRQYLNFRQVAKDEDILRIIQDLPTEKHGLLKDMRTWGDAGRETASILNQTRKNC
jgi:glycosyltransferase involved in cell wall biosynthesis